MSWTCPHCHRTLPLKESHFKPGRILTCACGCEFESFTDTGACGDQREESRLAKADNGIPCEHRGVRVDRINCGCGGVEFTWRCNNPAVESEVCILRKRPKMPAEIKALPCCLCCALRTAPAENCYGT